MFIKGEAVFYSHNISLHLFTCPEVIVTGHQQKHAATSSKLVDFMLETLGIM